MTQILDAGWKLESLRIEFQTYGDYKGKYCGKVRFNNREDEAFMFNLTPDDTEKYLQLINEKLVATASHLGDRLLASLNLLPAPREIVVPALEQPNE